MKLFHDPYRASLSHIDPRSGGGVRIQAEPRNQNSRFSVFSIVYKPRKGSCHGPQSCLGNMIWKGEPWQSTHTKCQGHMVEECTSEPRGTKFTVFPIIDHPHQQSCHGPQSCLGIMMRNPAPWQSTCTKVPRDQIYSFSENPRPRTKFTLFSIIDFPSPHCAMDLSYAQEA